MAEWPTYAELARILDVVLPEEYNADDPLFVMLERVLAAAIAHVKLDVGDWDDYVDVPDAGLSQAALRMAELMSLRPEIATSAGVNDPTYWRLMFGHKRTFGVA